MTGPESNIPEPVVGVPTTVGDPLPAIETLPVVNLDPVIIERSGQDIVEFRTAPPDSKG
jgi:hypothetical protein